MVLREEEGTPAAATADAPQTASQQFTAKPNDPATVNIDRRLHTCGRKTLERVGDRR
jgi:hypothetical protein